MSQAIENNSLPAVMQNKLQSVRWRQAGLAVGRCVAIAGAVLIVGMVMAMAADWWFTLFSTTARMALTLAIVTCTVAALIGTGLRPLVEAFRWNRAATNVDDEIPQLEERWTTVANFASSNRQPESRTGQAMLQQVTSEAVAMGSLVKPAKVVRPTSLKPAAMALGAAIVVLALFMLSNWGQTSILMQRFWSPLANITATQLASETGDRIVPRGEALDIVTRLAGVPRDSATIVLDMGEFGPEEIELTPEEETPGAFVCRLDVDESFRYQVFSGDGRTEWHSITAIDYPELSEVNLVVTPPEYVDRAPFEKTLIPGRIKAIQGSYLKLEMRPNAELASFEMHLARGTGEAADQQTLRMTPEDDGWYRFETQIMEDFSLSPVLLNQHNLTNDDRRICNIHVITDKAPVARVINSAEEMAVSATDVLDIPFEAHDDHGIATAELVVYDETNRQEGEEPRILMIKEIPLEEQQLQKHVMGLAKLDLKELGLEEGQSISYAVRVTDNRMVQLDPREVARQRESALAKKNAEQNKRGDKQQTDPEQSGTPQADSKLADGSDSNGKGDHKGEKSSDERSGAKDQRKLDTENMVADATDAIDARNAQLQKEMLENADTTSENDSSSTQSNGHRSDKKRGEVDGSQNRDAEGENVSSDGRNTKNGKSDKDTRDGDNKNGDNAKDLESGAVAADRDGNDKNVAASDSEKNDDAPRKDGDDSSATDNDSTNEKDVTSQTSGDSSKDKEATANSAAGDKDRQPSDKDAADKNKDGRPSDNDAAANDKDGMPASRDGKMRPKKDVPAGTGESRPRVSVVSENAKKAAQDAKEARQQQKANQDKSTNDRRDNKSDSQNKPNASNSGGNQDSKRNSQDKSQSSGSSQNSSQQRKNNQNQNGGGSANSKPKKDLKDKEKDDRDDASDRDKEKKQTPRSPVAMKRMSGQSSEAGQRKETKRRRLKISERLAAVAEATKRTKEADGAYREKLVELDELLAVVEKELSDLLKGLNQDLSRSDQFRKMDEELGDIEQVVSDFRDETRDTEFVFIGQQLLVIKRTHITPARDYVFAAIKEPDAAAESFAGDAQHHVMTAREQLQALIKKYDRVKRDMKYKKNLDESIKMYEIYVEKAQRLMRAARQGAKAPFRRDMAVIEADQAYLDRYAEVARLQRDLMDEFGRLLADDPRLLAKYMEVIKRRRSSLWQQFTDLHDRQDEISQEVSGWVHVDDDRRETLWFTFAELRLYNARDLVKEAVEVAERMESQLPLVLNASEGTAALAVQHAKQIAKHARRCSLDAGELLKSGGDTSDMTDLAVNAERLVYELTELEAALDQLSFESEGKAEVEAFVSLRLAESRLLADHADAWSESAASIQNQTFHTMAHVDQQQMTIATELLRVDMLSIENDLEPQFQNADGGMPQKLANMTRDLLRLVEGITFNQQSAAFSLKHNQMERAARQQELALDKFDKAESLFKRLRRETAAELDKIPVQDPNIANLRDPTLDQFLARLEREPNVEAQLGLPRRPRNFRVRQNSMTWNGNGGGGSGDDGNGGGLAASARAAQERINREKQLQPSGKKKQKPKQREMSKEEREQQKAQAEQMKKMIEQAAKQAQEQAENPNRTPEQREQAQERAQRMQQMLQQMANGQIPENAWDRLAEAEETQAMMEALANGEAIPDEQWNKLRSTLADGIGQANRRTPPEDYVPAIDHYQDAIREIAPLAVD